jgi:hypothetical protein
MRYLKDLRPEPEILDRITEKDKMIKLVILVTDNGKAFIMSGTANEGIGIQDTHGNEFPAGFDVDGNLYINSCNEDGQIYRLDGEGYVANIRYDRIKKPISRRRGHMFFCKKCGYPHLYSSEIGKKHSS